MATPFGEGCDLKRDQEKAGSGSRLRESRRRARLSRDRLRWHREKSAKGRQRRAAGPFAADAIERQISDLHDLTTEQLKDVWTQRLGTEPPDIRSREVLLRLLAWRLQSEMFGGL